MTNKLYYEDGYQDHFTATVLSCEKTKKGYEAVLDQSAFYPEGGGQPADTGFLNDARVSYVHIKDEVIYHCIDKMLEPGSKVEGKIDFDRRFDLMQQHSGEHILSGLVNSRFGYNNVGFHMSGEYTTCDFDGEITKEEMQEIEDKANEAVFANLPVSCIIYDDTEIKDWTYRSKLDLKGKIRLVTIPGYDTCACCGIHVKTTGEIGMIKVVSVDRHRGGVRVTMLCGKRALKDYQKKQEIVAGAMQMMSAKPETVITHLTKLQDELSGCRQKNAELTSQLFEYKSQGYLKTEDERIFVYEEQLQADMLRRLCIMLTEKTEKPVLVLTGQEGALKYALGAASKDVRDINKEITARFEGKGGGKSGLCQGSLSGKPEEVEAFYKAYKD